VVTPLLTKEGLGVVTPLLTKEGLGVVTPLLTKEGLGVVDLGIKLTWGEPHAVKVIRSGYS